MPVRSLSSRVLVWPDRAAVEEALRLWAASQGDSHPELLRAGYFGSYARGEWGVGSDLDVLLIVRESALPWERRAASWDTLSLPVDSEILVYTTQEWEGLAARGEGFPATLGAEAVWVFERPA